MVTLNKKRYRMMFVVDPDAIPMRVYADPSTGLVRYAKDIEGQDTFEYLDYRRAGNLVLPYEVKDNGQTIERYDDRTPVATALHAPRGLLPAFQGTSRTIATDPSHDSPIFDCTIANVAARCLLDSGNSGLSMSSELASRLGVPVVGSYNVRGLGGYTTQVVRAGALSFGDVTIPPAYYVVLHDLRRYGYDVVLGADLIAATRLNLDIAAHTVTLDAPPLEGGVSIPLSFQHSVPVANVQLGNVAVPLAIDTGDASNVNLAYGFYTKHRDLFTVTAITPVGGIGGRSTELIGKIPGLSIGTLHVGPQTIGTTQSLVGTASGHLGAAFLRQFLVQLDYADSTMLLRLKP
jgi:hypothetical protein